MIAVVVRSTLPLRTLVLFVLFTLPCGGLHGQAALPPLEVRVNQAVDRGCEFLLRQQEPGGGFGTGDKVHPIGRTSLTLLTLLHGGFPAGEPRVARAIDFLIRHLEGLRGSRTSDDPPYRSTYETGITLMLLYALGPRDRFAREMEPLARFLIDTLDESQSMWGYPEGARDLSNSQYAVLGLRATLQRGIEPRGIRDALTSALRGVLKTQRPDGGFAYQPQRYSSGSMTVAGLAMIQVAEEFLAHHAAAKKDLAAARKARPAAEKWLADHYTVRNNPEGRALNDHNLHYYLYGLERYAAFCGVERIADHDWYREGAEFLLATQKDDASWGSLEQTCFAILFLNKASLTQPGEREHPTAAGDTPPANTAPAMPDADATVIRNWLLAGPFPATKGMDDALDLDPIKEARVRPARGKRAGKQEWLEHHADGELFDLIPVLVPKGGVAVDEATFYAATYLECVAAGDARLWLDADDGVRVLLDGAVVLEDHHHDLKENLHVDLHLEAGKTLLLIKLENHNYFARLRARLTTPDGGPLTGIESTITAR